MKLYSPQPNCRGDQSLILGKHHLNFNLLVQELHLKTAAQIPNYNYYIYTTITTIPNY